MALSLRLWLLRRLTRTTTTTATMAPLLIVLVLLCCLTTTSTTSTEAYFNGTTTATGRLTSASTSAYHVGFSFRSCDPIQGGTLLNQVKTFSSYFNIKNPLREFGMMKQLDDGICVARRSRQRRRVTQFKREHTFLVGWGGATKERKGWDFGGVGWVQGDSRIQERQF